MTATDLRPRSRPRRAAPPEQGAGSLRTRALVVAGAVVVLLVVVALVIVGTLGRAGSALSPTSTEPGGAKALATVLRQQGIGVTTTTTLDDTERVASRDPDATTVLVYDANGYLDGSQWTRLAAASHHLVALTPTETGLAAVAPGVRAGGRELTGVLSPECDLPALAQSDRVLGTGTRYTSTARDAVTCLPASSGGGYGLVQVAGGGATGTVTVVGTTSALSNQSVGADDNAAFALALLGDSPRLVWYQPSAADLPAGTGTLASLTPGWVTPGIALLLAAGLAAILWRGRRLGPLVVENLPVVVRSTETTEGRARLYQRGASRLHALDQLRIGVIPRLAGLIGLGRAAGTDEVVTGVAEFLRTDPRRIRDLLVDADPVDDARLLALAGELRDLEAAVARAVRPAADAPGPAGARGPATAPTAPPASAADSPATDSQATDRKQSP